jgi:uncharacterized protein YggE
MSRTGALLFVTSWFLVAVPAGAQETPAVPSVVTTGEATVRRAPDQAFVTVAVESRSKNPRDAQRQNAETMTAVQQRLAASGVAKEAVRTLGYSIQQEFDYPNGRRVPREFVARNALEVRVEPVERTGDIIDAAVQAGATAVSGVRFELKDRAGAEREALRMAVADARGRADAAAAGAGRSVDRVLKIEEVRAGMAPLPRQMMMTRAAADASVETPVEPGTIEIRALVTLTVSIK